jgi:hypothetical protein
MSKTESGMKANVHLAANLLVVSAAVAALASCGGGGGGGGGGAAGGPPPSTPVTMTAANAQPAVDEVLGASLSFITVGNGTSNGGLVPFAAAKPRSQQKLQPLIALLRRQFSGPSEQAGARVPAAATQSACDGGGTQTVDPEPAVNPTTNTVTFVNCASGGQTINGTLMVTNITNPSAGNFSGHVSHNLTVVQTGSPALASSGEFDIAQTTVGTVVTDTLMGGPINLQQGADFAILSGLTLTSTVDTSSGAVTDSLAGTIATTLLGGSVTVATPTTLQADPGHPPNVGQMLITGASNSKVRFTVLGDDTLIGNQVRIEVDPEGDGTFQAPVETTWADL